MDHIFLYSSLYLAFLMLLSLYRGVFGPTVVDRMISVNAIGSKTTVMLILIGLLYHRVDMFVDIALAYAMLNFVAVVCWRAAATPVSQQFQQRSKFPGTVSPQLKHPHSADKSTERWLSIIAAARCRS